MADDAGSPRLSAISTWAYANWRHVTAKESFLFTVKQIELATMYSSFVKSAVTIMKDVYRMFVCLLAYFSLSIYHPFFR